MGDEDNTDGMLSTPTIVGVAVGGAVVLLAVGVGVGVCATQKKKKQHLVRPKGISNTNEDDSDSSEDEFEGKTTQRRASVTPMVIERSCSTHSVMVCDWRQGPRYLVYIEVFIYAIIFISECV